MSDVQRMRSLVKKTEPLTSEEKAFLEGFRPKMKDYVEDFLALKEEEAYGQAFDDLIALDAKLKS